MTQTSTRRDLFIADSPFELRHGDQVVNLDDEYRIVGSVARNFVVKRDHHGLPESVTVTVYYTDGTTEDRNFYARYEVMRACQD